MFPENISLLWYILLCVVHKSISQRQCLLQLKWNEIRLKKEMYILWCRSLSQCSMFFSTFLWKSHSFTRKMVCETGNSRTVQFPFGLDGFSFHCLFALYTIFIRSFIHSFDFHCNCNCCLLYFFSALSPSLLLSIFCTILFTLLPLIRFHLFCCQFCDLITKNKWDCCSSACLCFNKVPDVNCARVNKKKCFKTIKTNLSLIL